jgi:hypothetical protein
MAKRKRPTIIHVGLHKTGTTFLQRWIFPLLRDGVAYVPTATIEYGTSGWSISCHSPGLNDSLHESLLLSNEAIAGGLFDVDMSRLSALKRFAPDARIIFSIREQRSMLRSTYWQVVKQGWPHDYGTFQDRIFESGKLDYAALRQKVEAEFGPANALFILFEELISEPQTVMRRIATFAESRSIPEVGKTHPEKRSPVPMVVESQRLLNKIGLTRDVDNSFLRGTVITGTAVLSKRCDLIWEKVIGKRFSPVPSYADCAAIERHYAASNQSFFTGLYDTAFASRYPGMVATPVTTST